MKQRTIIMISIALLCLSSFGQVKYNCNIEYVKKTQENLNTLTPEIIKEFLLTFQKDCSANSEYIEFSNETLFGVLNSNPQLFMMVLNENKQTIQYKMILEAIECPISDSIDLEGIKVKIKALKSNNELKKDISRALDKVISKEKN